MSAILDLYDRRIVSYVISERNDNAIVFDTFRTAVKANPDAHPLFHSDRGFQYTSHAFHHMLEESGMTQSICALFGICSFIVIYLLAQKIRKYIYGYLLRQNGG